MNLALEQAKKILGNTKKNPAVGCIIIKNHHVVSAGNTSMNGKPHAEQNAINFSKIALKNSELYVTLEPCSHYGKTPPCVNSIIKSKIKKVIFSINDPDSRSFNKCAKKLKSKGIIVINEVLRDKIAKSINISLRKRPIDSESIEKFISKIVRNLEGLGENEIPTSTIGKFVMEGLANLDQVAYVRFASVYKNFKEAKDFEQFVGNLDENKS